MLKSIAIRTIFGLLGHHDHGAAIDLGNDAGHDHFDPGTIDETPTEFVSAHHDVGDGVVNSDPFLQEHADVGPSGPNGGPSNDPDMVMMDGDTNIDFSNIDSGRGSEVELPIFRGIPKLSDILAAQSNPDVGPSGPNGGPSNDPDRVIPSPEMRERIRRTMENM